jgi:hypothetical protein
MEEDLQKRIAELERRLDELEQKDKIVVVGSFDGTDIPVQVNGIRRKIATSAP